MQVFICYSRADKQFASQLVEDLANYDLTVWMDVRSIPTGANWDMEVQKGLDTSDVMLVLLSKASVNSQNVADEWSYFVEKNKTIIPIMVEPCEVPFRLSRRQRVDFTADYRTGFEKLLKALGSPEPLDPDSTQRIRPVSPPSAVSGSQAKPQSKPNKAAPSPAGKKPALSATPEVGIRRFQIVWSEHYHWFNGMGNHASAGDMMVDKHEIKLIPHTKPIISIPMRSLVSAAKQRSVDNHLKLTYYGPDGSFQSLVLMGAAKDKRHKVNEEILNLLKLLTGRSLS
jgi:hypothetical protein